MKSTHAYVDAFSDIYYTSIMVNDVIEIKPMLLDIDNNIYVDDES